MTKKRVFISFDFDFDSDNDRVLRDFMLGQAKLPDSPFEVIDHSLKEAAPERNWETKARAAIARSDIVIVMVGNATPRHAPRQRCIEGNYHGMRGWRAGGAHRWLQRRGLHLRSECWLPACLELA